LQILENDLIPYQLGIKVILVLPESLSNLAASTLSCGATNLMPSWNKQLWLQERQLILIRPLGG